MSAARDLLSAIGSAGSIADLAKIPARVAVAKYAGEISFLDVAHLHAAYRARLAHLSPPCPVGLPVTATYASPSGGGE